eukprot:GSChrysophyteH1.ASY1.ANO1.1415.1 assembled CDS
MTTSDVHKKSVSPADEVKTEPSAEVLSASILAAQAEADALADELEGKDGDPSEVPAAEPVDENAVLPAMPKLLQLPRSDLVAKTEQFKNKGDQLDLLLLKAESYSQFIIENQARSPRKNSRSASPGDSSALVPAPGVAIFKQPSSLRGGNLMPYQLEGLQWLLSLWENGLSGILADEMGLGKTIQIISLIAQLRLNNTPVVLYHGSKAEREEIRRKQMPFLERYVWQYMILDEGHRIRNRNCKLIKELKKIHTVSRLLLTGTPIQNTLEELWSLLNFCSPQIFDDLEVFQSWFNEIVAHEQHQRIVTKLHDILRPFLLRRMKTDVLLKMPPRREIAIYCGMSSLQKEYSLHIHNKSLRNTLLSMNIENAKESGLLNPTMQLRKAANHPFLFEKDPNLLIYASGKLRVLDRMLKKLRKDGHKVLIFSQMTQMLDILEDYLEHRSWAYCRLDGATSIEDRQDNIDAFQAKDSDLFVFLLSTRAGGLGINLTAADTVILLDSDWNPHADNQAQNRCHRIGQVSPVVTYRLLTAGSVEIDMMEKQISKKKLERMTIHGGDYRKAGQRQEGSHLTLAILRQLLEDDVKNLAPNRDGDSDRRGLSMDIQEFELKTIMNRKMLFPVDPSAQSGYGDSKCPREGIMYDVVEERAGTSLQGVKYE